MLKPHELETAVKRQLKRGNSLRALLLFGSRVSGSFDAQSDYDLLAVTSLDQAPRVVLECGETLDIIFGTPLQFEHRLRERNRDNNNFDLNNFADSLVLSDPFGVGSSLQTKAREMYGTPPEGLSREEAENMARAMRKMLRVVKNRILRSRRTAEEDMLNILRIDEIVMKAVYNFFRSERQWTQAYYKLIRDKLPAFPSMLQLWNAHVETFRDPEAHFKTGTTMVEYICEQLETRAASVDRAQERPVHLRNVNVLNE